MKHSSDFTYSLEGDYAERKPQELVEAKCAWLRLLALLYLLARRFNTNQLHMEKIKTLAEAEELVKQGQDIYLVAFITKNNTQGSCLVCTTESLPLYKIYFIMNEANKEQDLITILSVQKLT